jgi:hypothetical protein
MVVYERHIYGSPNFMRDARRCEVKPFTRLPLGPAPCSLSAEEFAVGHELEEAADAVAPVAGGGHDPLDRAAI